MLTDKNRLLQGCLLSSMLWMPALLTTPAMALNCENKQQVTQHIEAISQQLESSTNPSSTQVCVE
jgi:hypothetical protein